MPSFAQGKIKSKVAPSMPMIRSFMKSSIQRSKSPEKSSREGGCKVVTEKNLCNRYFLSLIVEPELSRFTAVAINELQSKL